MYSIKEAARELSFTTRAVYSWIRDGKIKAIKVMSEWRIPKEEIERLKAGEQNVEPNDSN